MISFPHKDSRWIGDNEADEPRTKKSGDGEEGKDKRHLSAKTGKSAFVAIKTEIPFSRLTSCQKKCRN